MKTVVSKRIIFATILGLALPVMTEASVSVRFGSHEISAEGIDLNSEAGAKVLYAKLQRASEKACDLRSFSEHTSTATYFESKTCFAKTLGSAVSKFDSDALRRLHAES